MLLLFTVGIFSCEKDDSIPFSDVPEIELISISHDTVVEFCDNEIITIQYKDGDGNLGFEEPEKYAVFVRDIRLANFDGFYIGPLAPLGSSVPIQGEIKIEFPNLFIFGNRDSERTQFEIKVVDRSGNQSNLVTTESVIIVKK